MEHNLALQARLHRDYEEIARLGLRRRPEGERLRAVVDGLVEAQLAVFQDDYLTLQRPQYAVVDFPAESMPMLMTHYEHWLHAERLTTGEEVLYGQIGFWQHWFNMLHESVDAPMQMDLVIPDLPEFDEHDWMGDMNLGLMNDVLGRDVMKVRLLLPPREAGGSIEILANFVTSLGIEVRVRSSPFLFAVYSGRSAVLAASEPDSPEESYFLTRRTSIVAPLQRVFDDHWAAGIGWESFVKGAADVLELMSLGWTDARIAETLGLSARTVSRRVAEAMSAAGVGSRFELGVRYAQQTGRAK